MEEIFKRLLGIQQGGPNVREAIRINRDDRIKRRQKDISNDYNISPIKTSRGEIDSWQTLQDWFRQAQYQRQNDLDSMPTQQELDYGQAPVQELRDPALLRAELNVQPTPAAVLGTSSYVAPNLGNYPGVESFARDWYSSKGHPDAADRAALLAREALEVGLDPYMALALGAQEGGWLKIASPEAPNNYLGLGETDSGSMNMGSATFEDWLNEYLPKSFMQPIYGETPYGQRTAVTEWGGPNSPYKYNYNYNQSWVDAITDLLAQQENFRRTQYQDLPESIIRY